jgi:hypothetical protein
MVLVHGDRDVGIEFYRGQHQVSKIGVLRVGSRPTRSLYDNRGIGFVGSFHDGLDLFHVVDIKSGDTVVIFSSVIQQCTQWDEGHSTNSLLFFSGKGLEKEQVQPVEKWQANDFEDPEDIMVEQ